MGCTRNAEETEKCTLRAERAAVMQMQDERDAAYMQLLVQDERNAAVHRDEALLKVCKFCCNPNGAEPCGVALRHSRIKSAREGNHCGGQSIL